MHVRLIGDSKLTVGANMRIFVCVGPVIDWQPVQGVPHLMPNGSRDRIELNWMKVGIEN